MSFNYYMNSTVNYYMNSTVNLSKYAGKLEDITEYKDKINI